MMPVVREVIVVDSGSTDTTLEIARSLERIRVLPYPMEEEFNYSKALNMGFADARCSHVASVSSHCIAGDPALLVEMLAELADPEVVGVYAFPSSKVERRNVDGSNFNGRNGLFNSFSLLRAADWRAHPFNESIAACEDQELSAHWIAQGRRVIGLGRPALRYLNPYVNRWKQLRDDLVIGYHVHPYPRSSLALYARLRHGLNCLMRGKVRAFAWECYCIAVLASSHYIHYRLRSAYHAAHSRKYSFSQGPAGKI
jgi:glycosyltransferase involved in cell wall biosynthesis